MTTLQSNHKTSNEHRAPLDRAALREVAQLHRQALPKAFLSSLGLEFLTVFYDGVQRYSGGLLFTATAEGKAGQRPIVGFISGVDNVNAFHRWMLRKHFPRAIWRAIPSLALRACLPSALRKLRELLFYPRRSQQVEVKLPTAELLSLGVAELQRRQGLAGSLYQQLSQAFSEQGVPAFRILVGSELVGARTFYEKQGAKAVATFPLHAGGETTVYVQELRGATPESNSHSTT